MAKVLFVQDIAFEFLGPMYLSATLKKHGHQCRMAVTSLDKHYERTIHDYGPDLIAFSTSTGPHHWVLRTAAAIKAKFDIPIIVGGPHPTFFPDFINDPAIDMICRGEGEDAMLELANRLDAREDLALTKNLWVKKDGAVIRNELRPLVEDLDTIPFPDRKLYQGFNIIQDIPAQRVLSGRGCPYTCTFCFNSQLRGMYKGKGKYLRKRGIENLLQEIKEVTGQRKTRLVRFPDDTFTVDHDWCMELLPRYQREIGIPFTCLAVARELDEDLVKAMKLAGCLNIFFGVETGNNEVRHKLLKKYVTNEELLAAAGLLKKYRIKFGTYNMYGLPEETVARAFETIELNRQMGTDFPHSDILQPYPGTPIMDIISEKGLLKPNFEYKELELDGSIIQGKEIKQLENLQKFSYLAIKHPFLTPLIKQLIKLPPNMGFRLIHDLFSISVFKNSLNLDWFTVIKLGIKLRNKF